MLKKLFTKKKPAELLLSLIVLLILTCVVILMVKSRSWRLLWDAAVFHYLAWLITEGVVPYRDIFDIQFPGTYIVHILIIKLLGGSDGAWRIFDLSCLVIIDGLILLFCRPFGRLTAWLGVALFSSFHLFNGPLYAGQRDYYLIIFIISGMYFIARYMEKRSGILLLVLSGLLLGAGASIKPYAGLLCLFLLAILFLHAFLNGRKWCQPCIVFLFSLSVVPVALLIWLWVIGGLYSFIDIALNYLLPFYSKFKFQLFSPGRFSLFTGLPFAELLLVAVIGLISCFNNSENRLRKVLLFTGLVYGFFHYFMQVHNEYQLYPFAFFLFIIIASWVKEITCRYPLMLKILMAIIVLHVSLQTLYRSTNNIITPPFYITDFKCKNDLVRDLRDKVPPGKTVQVMDSMSGAIHALYVMKYHQPTRFFFDALFFHDISAPYIQSLRREFLNKLQHDPPLFFVVTKVSWPLNGYERLKEFPELLTWINNNYALEVQREYYRLYKRVSR